MTRFTRWQALTVLVAAASTLPATLLLAQGARGLKYTQTMTMAMPEMTGQPPVTSTASVQQAGEKVRAEFTTADPTMGMNAGDYLLSTGEGLFLVRPSVKTYVAMSDMISGAMAGAGAAGMPTITGVQLALEKLGAAEELQGHKTERFRIKGGYAMEMMGQTMPTEIVTEIWAAKLPVNIGVANANLMAGGSMGEAMKALSDRMAELYREIGEATPLKMVTSTSLSMGGMSVTTTQTVENSSIQVVELDPSIFELPKGFTKVDR